MSLKQRSLATALAATLTVLAVGAAPVAAQAPPNPEERVAALKQSLGENQAKLRKYEWIETTIISLKGEEKARKQQRCYYGADGKVQKVPIAGAPQAAPQESKGGRGGRGGRLKENIVENKKEDMQEYMERAAALIHQYVPPQPAQIQKVKDAGALKVAPAGQGVVRLELPDYVQPGDKLVIDVNAAANSIAAVNVASYLDKKEDTVTLDVKFATLTDGTSYSQQTTLDVKAKDIRVVVQNSGHRPMTP